MTEALICWLPRRRCFVIGRGRGGGGGEGLQRRLDYRDQNKCDEPPPPPPSCCPPSTPPQCERGGRGGCESDLFSELGDSLGSTISGIETHPNIT